jgi:hypothetical protein
MYIFTYYENACWHEKEKEKEETIMYKRQFKEKNP